jgi:serine/threonine protein kinase
MSAVYEGYQMSLRRQVAVKVLKPELAHQEQYLARFNDEAEIAAQLTHQHIVPIYDYGVDKASFQSDVSFIVMRMLTGGSLWERIRPHLTDSTPVMPLPEIAALLKQLGSALDYAHHKGVVHRDIKPSNIMFDDQGTACLVDFGIAQMQNKVMRSSKLGSQQDMLMGTFAYIAPEMWLGEAITGAVDQYALGLISYTLITGHAPYNAGPNEEYRMRGEHLTGRIIPLHKHRPELPETLSTVVERAVAKRPEQRFRNVKAFADAFEVALKMTDLTNEQNTDGSTRRFSNLKASVLRNRVEDYPSRSGYDVQPAKVLPTDDTRVVPANAQSLNMLTDEYMTRNLRPQYDLNMLMRRSDHKGTRLFMIYREEDVGRTADKISARFKQQFGSRSVFNEVENIPLGANIKKTVKNALPSGTVGIVLIGPHWLEAKDASGVRCIDRANDILRISIEAALEAEIPLIPLLVDDADYPPADMIPESIRDLVQHRGAVVRPEPDFHDDMTRLTEQLESLFKQQL